VGINHIVTVTFAHNDTDLVDQRGTSFTPCAREERS
jgi:hypothetical protein